MGIFSKDQKSDFNNDLFIQHTELMDELINCIKETNRRLIVIEHILERRFISEEEQVKEVEAKICNAWIAGAQKIPPITKD